MDMDNTVFEEPMECVDDFEVNFNAEEITSHLEDYLRFFSIQDMDIIFLYHLADKKQVEVGTLLAKTQAAISYDISRIRNQINVISRVNSVFDEFFECLKGADLASAEADLLIVFFCCSSFGVTASILSRGGGMRQALVKARFGRICEKLAKSGHKRLLEILKVAHEHRNQIKKNTHKPVANRLIFPCKVAQPTKRQSMKNIIDDYQWHSAIGIPGGLEERKLVREVLASDPRMAKFMLVKPGSEFVVNKSNKTLWRFCADGSKIEPVFEEDVLTQEMLDN